MRPGAHDEPTPAEPEVALGGGMGSGGQVVRVGDTVRRPWRDHTESVHAFLDHLAGVGFIGAPRVLGCDPRGREVLSWLDGDVGIPPFPDWVADEELLLGVADLQRSMHAAAQGFTPPPGAVWDTANLPPAAPDAIVCHNDLCVENVVVCGRTVVGFIDFDFAAPADPLLDIAIAARHWMPVRDRADIADARGELDLVARFHRFTDVHELDRPARATVVGHLGDYLDRALVSMRARAEGGNESYRQVWAQGYPLQNRRSRQWLDTHADALIA
jgi:Phosphotransferase enzyme family